MRPGAAPQAIGLTPPAREALSRRRAAALALMLAMVTASPASARSEDEAAAWAALRDGAIVLFRHAQAPGVGDPPGLTLGDCSTQRNLDAGGREHSRRMGQRLKREAVPVGAVWASQWCRTRQTAELAALGPVREMPAFNSFFGDRGDEPAQTAAARSLLLGWRGPGTLVVVTHQVNISALTGQGTASGEGVVLRPQDGALQFVGRIRP
jgi:phosphohistidine phosphatase SixA